MNCKFTKPDGTKCRAKAMKNNLYCLPHQNQITKTENEFKQVTENTGLKKILSFLPDMHIEKIDDLPPFLIDTIRNVRRGVIQAKIGSVIGYLTSVLLRTYEVTDIQKRIERLEELVSASFIEIKDIELPKAEEQAKNAVNNLFNKET